jgi:putative ABC transport system permease protein
MGLTRLALAYARRRPLATALVVLLLAAGTAVVALTLLVARELEARLTRDAAGIDLVVGAKGSPLQLVLAGVFHVDVPPGNIPLAAVAALRADPMIAQAIPLALGDSFRGFRIVGTDPALVEHYGGRLAAGALWTRPMEAVLGSEVARVAKLGVGGSFAGSHGLSEGGGEHGDDAYRVTGVLAPTGTVLDRMALTSVESVWAVHDAHHGAEEGDDPQAHEAAPAAGKGSAVTSGQPLAPSAGEAPGAGSGSRMPRAVTMVLVRYVVPLAAASLPRQINESTNLVAASPAYETARLLSIFGIGIDLLRAFAWLLIVASALMLFVALAQALDERRYDLAILRTLGASRLQVAWVLIAESVTLALVGALLGLAAAHVIAAFAGKLVPAAAPLAAGAWTPHPEEALVLGIAVAVGILAALWPAWQAYRLDVAATLADS